MARRNNRVSTQDKIQAARTKKATAFRKKATTLAPKAEAKLGDRDMGTWRKFNQAMAARRDGYQMLRLGTVLSFLAEGLDADSLDYPLSTLCKVAQVEDAIGVAAKFGLDEAAIKQRDMERSSLWTATEITAECDKPDSTIGELYGDLALANPDEMLALIQRLHDIIEGSGCINWDAEELLRLRAEVRMQKIPGFVRTPAPLADELLGWLALEEGDLFCEPAAGDGAILERLRVLYPHVDQIRCCEINYSLSQILRLSGFEPICRDYFDWQPTGGDRPNKIGANPPFEGMEDVDFVLKMWDDLARGGRMAVITSNSWSFNSKTKAKNFRTWLENVPQVLCNKENAPDAFKPSGYNIQTRLLVLEKPE